MTGHRAIPYGPAGQPWAAGYGCTGLVRLIYASRAKVNVFVSTTHTTSVEPSTTARALATTPGKKLKCSVAQLVHKASPVLPFVLVLTGHGKQRSRPSWD